MPAYTRLPDLRGTPSETVASTIQNELAAAGLSSLQSQKPDDAGWTGEYSLDAISGIWTLRRDRTVWLLRCKVPLATAEVIVANEICRAGCIPMQWLPDSGNQLTASEVHTLARLPDYVFWTLGTDALYKIGDRNEQQRKFLEERAGLALALGMRFVEDPEAVGEPFILAYTFFTLAALVKFFEVIKRHRVLPATLFTNKTD